MSTTLDVTRPRVIRDEAEYEAALAEVERLLGVDPDPGTEEGDRLDTLAILVEAYEREHYPMTPPTPQAAVAFRLEQLGLTRADLAPIIGGRSRVSEFFTAKRPLSITQLVRVRDALGIPADRLIPPAKKPRGRPKAARSR